ncbi:Rrf2 family transcriptional regulator [Oxalobacteraceae bacterium R-40]|uniref:Rrf2 family transcriptional regulator n=1 Tax=Keguizhuia sedimenti TaxID=3064264 RepID=A0ABU1BQE2_9BURK|nr:Rrf2 family transcriptional regulator [Oxalobacteraceae bacterium R-40]
MRLTTYTDYALRTLMFLALNRDKLVTIQDIADAHKIAKNHLTKVVHQLSSAGLIESLRGRNGGLKLGKEPADINVGDVVRLTEHDFFIAECFDINNKNCIYSSSCALKGVLNRATSAFLDVLDGVTLDSFLQKDVVRTKAKDGKPVTVHFKQTSYKKKEAAVSRKS